MDQIRDEYEVALKEYSNKDPICHYHKPKTMPIHAHHNHFDQDKGDSYYGG